MVIDFHAHIFPDKVAEKATDSISRFYENTPMAYRGHVDTLINSGDKIGVVAYVVHSTATKPEQVANINTYIIGECSKQKKFIGFGTLHPDCDINLQEIDRLLQNKIHGIKLHPDFQTFQFDTPKMDAVYDRLSEVGMPILVHAGDYRYDFSGPQRIANVIKKFPKLKIVAAHFGGYTQWEDSMKYLVGKRVWFDTSSTLWKLPVDKADEMIRKHGVENFFFGSDYPMWDHQDELNRFNKLTLTDSEREKILLTNALGFLDMKVEDFS